MHFDLKDTTKHYENKRTTYIYQQSKKLEHLTITQKNNVILPGLLPYTCKSQRCHCNARFDFTSCTYVAYHIKMNPIYIPIQT